MAFKFTKAEEAKRTELVIGLREKFSEIETAIAAYNELVQEAQEWKSDLAGRVDDEINEKSERWQEGERGQAAQAWKDAIENIDTAELDIPDETLSAELEDLADEMED